MVAVIEKILKHLNLPVINSEASPAKIIPQLGMDFEFDQSIDDDDDEQHFNQDEPKAVRDDPPFVNYTVSQYLIFSYTFGWQRRSKCLVL